LIYKKEWENKMKTQKNRKIEQNHKETGKPRRKFPFLKPKKNGTDHILINGSARSRKIAMQGNTWVRNGRLKRQIGFTMDVFGPVASSLLVGLGWVWVWPSWKCGRRPKRHPLEFQ
jgi:hypothetical protein